MGARLSSITIGEFLSRARIEGNMNLKDSKRRVESSAEMLHTPESLTEKQKEEMGVVLGKLPHGGPWLVQQRCRVSL